MFILETGKKYKVTVLDGPMRPDILSEELYYDHCLIDSDGGVILCFRESMSEDSVFYNIFPGERFVIRRIYEGNT